MPRWYDDGSEEEYQMQQAGKAEKAKERELAAASPAGRPEQTALPDLPEETQEDSDERHNRWVKRVFAVIDDAEDSHYAIPEGESTAHAGMDAELELLLRERQLLTACNNYEALKLSHAACVEQLQSIFQQVTNGRVCYFGDHTGYTPQFSTTQTCQWEEALANAKKITEGL